MPCYEQGKQPAGLVPVTGAVYQTQAECDEKCKPGACCDGAACDVKMECECKGAGKVFKGPGTACDAGICDPDPVGACCGPDFTCVQVKRSVCQANGGRFLGPGVACAANICRYGACCAPDGGCTQTRVGDCAAPSAWSGYGTRCDGCSPMPDLQVEISGIRTLPPDPPGAPAFSCDCPNQTIVIPLDTFQPCGELFGERQACDEICYLGYLGGGDAGVAGMYAFYALSYYPNGKPAYLRIMFGAPGGATAGGGNTWCTGGGGPFAIWRVADMGSAPNGRPIKDEAECVRVGDVVIAGPPTRIDTGMAGYRPNWCDISGISVRAVYV